MSKPARRVLELLVLLYWLLPMKLEGYDSRYQYAVPVPVPYEYEKVPTGTIGCKNPSYNIAMRPIL